MLNGKQVESYRKLAEIYIKENDNPKAIEMLENSLQLSNFLLYYDNKYYITH